MKIKKVIFILLYLFPIIGLFLCALISMLMTNDIIDAIRYVFGAYIIAFFILLPWFLIYYALLVFIHIVIINNKNIPILNKIAVSIGSIFFLGSSLFALCSYISDWEYSSRIFSIRILLLGVVLFLVSIMCLKKKKTNEKIEEVHCEG